MNEKKNPARWLLLAALILAAFGPAVARERGPYSIQILVDGAPLAEHAARGKTYVEAREGREYSIRLTNQTSRRVAVALSVDGLNVIDAKSTSASQATKWILGPHGTITLDGWQTGPSTARRFFFTTEDRSYGAWLGKTADLGLISAAFFREKRPVPAPIHQPRRDSSPDSRSRKRRLDSGSAAPTESEGKAEAMPETSGELAATGIGEEIEHRIRRVAFDAERSPAAVKDLRYEYHDALVRLGVIQEHYGYRTDPLDRRERARGFDGFEFAPDPYR